jgi:[acyl-carrier-protein] S-malonyltransferase
MRVVVVCPGRGTYNAGEWGYLARHHAARGDVLAQFDRYRAEQGQPTLSALDGQTPYAPEVHGRGDHASALIFACAYLDALALDAERCEIVAVTGNSMGWYIALAVAQALAPPDALHLVNTMGRLMHESALGGQVLQPFVDEDWRELPGERARLLGLVEEIHGGDGAQLHLSIDLGGMLVFGGNEPGLTRLTAALPKRDRYPMRLHQHSAFHTPLQTPVRERARAQLSAEPFRRPAVPLVDGRGQVWTPWSTDPERLWDYTLGHQLVAPYDFTRAVQVAVKEFAPDALVVLGPGTTLGGAVAQALIGCRWRELASKRDFTAQQAREPFVLSLGLPAQRARIVR